jgi:ATP-binding cassette, subfamily B, bacterial
MMPGDKDALKGVELREGTLRRVWTFARPYRGTIIVFLLAILGAALLALVPVFVIRAIIDNAIPERRQAPDRVLASIAVARCDRRRRTRDRPALGERQGRRRPDLRPARRLFAKIQRMPIAFFTRTPTGSITSRSTTT